MATELAAGTMVTANVRLVKELGRGGMGSVWVADHLSLRTQVAVKFISADLVASEPTMVARFNREAALCAQMKSAHVVQTFDHGVTDDGTPYLVMELLEGESLAERLERGCLSLAETQRVVDHVCRALARAHKLGVVHRDIKPDNIFLVRSDDEPVCKVLDFGVAKQSGMGGYSVVTATGAMVGTPEYMSPEQVLSAKAVDHRSDLWAVGVVAYHALTGAMPFRGETLGGLCVAIAKAEPLAASSLRPELSPEVDVWFERALAASPDERFDSARELAAAFDAALEGRPRDASGDEPPARTSAPHARHDDRSATHRSRPAEARTAGLGPRETATFAGATSPIAAARARRGRIALLGLFAAAAASALIAAVVAGMASSPRPASSEVVPPSHTAQVTTSSPTTPAQGATTTTDIPTASAEPTTSASAAAAASASVSTTASDAPGAASDRALPPRPTPPPPRPTYTQPRPPASALPSASTGPSSLPPGSSPPPASSPSTTAPQTTSTTKDRGF